MRMMEDNKLLFGLVQSDWDVEKELLFHGVIEVVVGMDLTVRSNVLSIFSVISNFSWYLSNAMVEVYK